MANSVRATPTAISSDSLHEWCLAAGIYGPEDLVHRVVIDIQAGKVVEVYVYRIGDDRILTVEPMKIVHGDE